MSSLILLHRNIYPKYLKHYKSYNTLVQTTIPPPPPPPQISDMTAISNFKARTKSNDQTDMKKEFLDKIPREL